MRVVFSPEAQAEFGEAIAYYPGHFINSRALAGLLFPREILFSRSYE